MRLPTTTDKPIFNVPDREDVRAAAYTRSTVATDEPTFNAGFDAGERYGYTYGFKNGADEAIRGLTGVPDRGLRQRAAFTQQGNMVGDEAISTGIQQIGEDQLTAELVQILSAYAVLPSRNRIMACLEAMKSIPGFGYNKLVVEDVEEGR